MAVAVSIFGLAGLAVAAAIPSLYANGAEVPPFPVFLLVGLAAVVVAALLFAFSARLDLGFGGAALARRPSTPYFVGFLRHPDRAAIGSKGLRGTPLFVPEVSRFRT